MSEYNPNYPQQQQQQYEENYPQQQPYGGNYPQQQTDGWSYSQPPQPRQPQWGNYPEQQHQGFVEPPSYVDNDNNKRRQSLSYNLPSNPGEWRTSDPEKQDDIFPGFSDQV